MRTDDGLRTALAEETRRLVQKQSDGRDWSERSDRWVIGEALGDLRGHFAKELARH